MNGDITRKQRSRFFATNVAAFAFIFFREYKIFCVNEKIHTKKEVPSVE